MRWSRSYLATPDVASVPKATVQRGTQPTLIPRHGVTVVAWRWVVTIVSWRRVVAVRRRIPLALLLPILPTRFPALMTPPSMLLASWATVVAIIAAIPPDRMEQ